MRKLYLIIFIALLSLQASAQVTLHFTRIQFNINTISSDNTPLEDTIVNQGSGTFQGSIFFAAKVVSTDSVLPFPIDSADFNTNPLDSNGSGNNIRRILIHVPYNNPMLIGGPTGVVIWPTHLGGGNVTHVDSIRLTVTVTPVGLEEAPLAKIYLTQREQMLNIHFGDYGDLVQQVSLYNISGQTMFAGSPRESQNIPVAQWSAGIYFCQIVTQRGERRTIKFILQ